MPRRRCSPAAGSASDPWPASCARVRAWWTARPAAARVRPRAWAGSPPRGPHWASRYSAVPATPETHAVGGDGDQRGWVGRGAKEVGATSAGLQAWLARAHGRLDLERVLQEGVAAHADPDGRRQVVVVHSGASRERGGHAGVRFGRPHAAGRAVRGGHQPDRGRVRKRRIRQHRCDGRVHAFLWHRERWYAERAPAPARPRNASTHAPMRPCAHAPASPPPGTTRVRAAVSVFVAPRRRVRGAAYQTRRRR